MNFAVPRKKTFGRTLPSPPGLDIFSFNYEKFPSNHFLSAIICLARLALGRAFRRKARRRRTHPPACMKPQ